MIDEEHHKSSEAVDEAVHQAQSLIVAAWQLAAELDGRNSRDGGALLTILSMAEDKLEEASKHHSVEWDILRKHSMPAA